MKHSLIDREQQRRLFFIIGVGRSGTRLLQDLMNTFPGFCNRIESVERVDGKRISYWTPVRQTGNFEPLEAFILRNWTSEFFVEKTPDSILCLPQALERFPEANFIFLLRDPLRVVLSQLNMVNDLTDFEERRYHIENLIMRENDLALPFEQYWAKLTLKQVTSMKANMEKFAHRLVVRYESLVSSLESQLNSIEKEFGLKADLEEARSVLARPSSSSKSNTYDITRLTRRQS